MTSARRDMPAAAITNTTCFGIYGAEWRDGPDSRLCSLSWAGAGPPMFQWQQGGRWLLPRPVPAPALERLGWAEPRKPRQFIEFARKWAGHMHQAWTETED